MNPETILIGGLVAALAVLILGPALSILDQVSTCRRRRRPLI